MYQCQGGHELNSLIWSDEKCDYFMYGQGGVLFHALIRWLCET